MPDVSEFASKTLKFSADVKNDESLNITVFQYDGSEYTSNATTIPANSDDNFSVTITVLETTTALWFGLDYVNATTENTCFYTDDWCLEEVTQ